MLLCGARKHSEEEKAKHHSSSTHLGGPRVFHLLNPAKNWYLTTDFDAVTGNRYRCLPPIQFAATWQVVFPASASWAHHWWGFPTLPGQVAERAYDASAPLADVAPEPSDGLNDTWFPMDSRDPAQPKKNTEFTTCHWQVETQSLKLGPLLLPASLNWCSWPHVVVVSAAPPDPGLAYKCQSMPKCWRHHK